MSIGNNIKRLRQNKGVTQEQLGEALGVSSQAVSKWENESALPDILTLPKLADYFGITIDEVMGYKFTTNAQIAKIGEFFADCIREHHITFDVIMGLAYHGIAFSTAAACALFQKYGITADYCFDRNAPDSRGNILCGHTLNDGDKVVIVDDLMSTGLTLCERIDRLKGIADIEVTAVIVIANLTNDEAAVQGLGAKMVEEKYGSKVYSIITEKDIHQFLEV